MGKLRPESRGAEPGRPEEERLTIVASIKSRADTFAELGAFCHGCGRRIWEAQAQALRFRGCGCMTFCYPPGHPLYEFNPQPLGRRGRLTLPKPPARGIASQPKIRN